MLRISVLLIAFLALTVAVTAEVPQTINYQGRLTDDTGEPVADDTYQIKFNIYGSESGADLLWTSGFQTVSITDGLFNYQLGSAVQLPDDLFSGDTTRYLGITVGVDPEISPRSRIVSMAYAYQSLRSDTADYAMSIADGSVTTTKLTTGAITTDKIASNAVTGNEILDGSVSGDDLASNSVNTYKVEDNSLLFIDINQNGASENQVMKWISGSWTAADDETGGGTNHQQYLHKDSTVQEVMSEVRFGDSTMRIDEQDGIQIGSFHPGSGGYLFRVERKFNTTRSLQNGGLIRLEQTGTGGIIGLNITCNYQGPPTSFGTNGLHILADGGNASEAYGLEVNARNSRADAIGIDVSANNASGDVIALNASVYDADPGSNCWAGYFDATCNEETDCGAGYFRGDVEINGHLSKNSGSFKIDHPLDPENKYLQHSFVESPDMMNIYNGNVVLDVGGTATVELPEYFEALNMEFRYQLTPVGAPGPNLYISSEIIGNSFEISGGVSGMKVSWQVTGIRKDKWAQEHRIQVEVEKDPDEKGLYRNPELFGFGVEKNVDQSLLRDMIEESDNK